LKKKHRGAFCHYAIAMDVEEINIIYSNQRYQPRRVRVFIDFLVERLGPLLSGGQ
jgi:DNA-binding transcriptional LysR family regulator